MVRLLKKSTFSEADIELPEVQAFYCGNEPWEKEVAEWIKSRSGDNSVLEDMRNYRTEVWLYRDPAGVLVGFGSLGQNKYTWPLKSKRKELVSVIPFIGVHKDFQGEPKGAKREDKYAYQILDDLLLCAAEKMDRYPLLTLSVDSRNTRAIQFYEWRDFVNLNLPKMQGEVTYVRMARPLEDIRAALTQEQEDDTETHE